MYSSYLLDFVGDCWEGYTANYLDILNEMKLNSMIIGEFKRLEGF